MGITCQRWLSRPILRNWLQRYEEFGLDGIVSKNRKPYGAPKKISVEQEQQILIIRHENNLGAHRIHSSLGKTPMDRVVELSKKTPFWSEVEDGYDSAKEFIRVHDYAKDVKLLKLKRYL